MSCGMDTSLTELIAYINSHLGGGAVFLYLFLIGLAAWSITFFTIPRVIMISRKKNLMDEPGHRSSHQRKISNLGGIAMFYSLAIIASIASYELFDRYKFLFASLVILFFIGVMDDIIVMRAYKKFFAHIVVSVLIVVGSDVRIESMFGLFGVYELPYLISALLSVLFFIFIINSFNLIDGIDGLAGTLSLLSSLFFLVGFYKLGSQYIPLMYLCMAIAGTVLGFLYYNFSEKRSQKIFMGDTGSMLLGFLLAFLSVSFLTIFQTRGSGGELHYHLPSAVVITMAILLIPITDTLSVIIKRVIKRKSIFTADNNHIHHSFLKMGLTHRQTTAVLSLYYLCIVALVYLLRHLDLHLLLVVVICSGLVLSIVPEIIYSKFIKNKTNHNL